MCKYTDSSFIVTLLSKLKSGDYIFSYLRNFSVFVVELVEEYKHACC